MDKKALQGYLVKAYVAGKVDVLTTQVYQDKPNTFALVTYVPSARTECGFAKCCGVTKRHPPDVWCAGYGSDMAIRKAIAKLAKKYHDSTEFLEVEVVKETNE